MGYVFWGYGRFRVKISRKNVKIDVYVRCKFQNPHVNKGVRKRGVRYPFWCQGVRKRGYGWVFQGAEMRCHGVRSKYLADKGVRCPGVRLGFPRR